MDSGLLILCWHFQNNWIFVAVFLQSSDLLPSTGQGRKTPLHFHGLAVWQYYVKDATVNICNSWIIGAVYCSVSCNPVVKFPFPHIFGVFGLCTTFLFSLTNSHWIVKLQSMVLFVVCTYGSYHTSYFSCAEMWAPLFADVDEFQTPITSRSTATCLIAAVNPRSCVTAGGCILITAMFKIQGSSLRVLAVTVSHANLLRGTQCCLVSRVFVGHGATSL